MPTQERAADSVLGSPLSTSNRRERLLRIRSANSVPAVLTSSLADAGLSSLPTESDPLNPNPSNDSSYGTLPPPRRRLFGSHSLNSRKTFDFDNTSFSRAFPTPTTPTSVFRELTYSRLSAQRPISAYDAPLEPKDGVEANDMDAKINGIRVWYSSFSSIDWLHDAIKDSVRFSRLRQRKSFRARLRLAFDKSLGWIIVTIVGFLTAIVAFLVVRSEQFLFDLKEGYCRNKPLRAKRLCCPQVDETVLALLSGLPLEEACPGWKTWSEKFAWGHGERGKQFVEYTSYTVIALFLALVSCLLTIYLTNSTTFVTRKESGVLSSDFDPDKKLRGRSAVPPKRKIMFYAAGSGIPEIKTILSGFVIHGYLGGRTLFTKAVGLALSVASGLTLGKEGPFVHIASCVGNIVSRIHSKYENNEAKRREILSAACAAGVAVAFGAPIGGTLFSLEEVSYFFPPKVMWRSFFCAMIAAITLKMLDPFGTGKLVLFQVTYDKDWHAYELLPFIFLGALGGVYGACFSKLNYRWSKHVRNGTWLKSHPITEVLLITLVTAILCFLNPYTRMGGTELVYNLFAECRIGSGNNHSGLCVLDPGSFEHVSPVITALLTALVVKGALTVVTFGIKVPAGIFIPTLGVGACAGRVLGIAMQYWQFRHPDASLFKVCNGDLDCIIPGLYAMVGAAATLSGVTRTTVSLAVIMFELTDTLTYAVPVMLAVLVAKTVADALEPKGIYDLVIELQQLPYLDAKHEYLWGDLQIEDITVRDVEVVRLDHTNTVTSLRDQLQILVSFGNDDSGFPILRKDGSDDKMRMVGFIGANELEHALSIVADEGDEEVHFQLEQSHRVLASSSISSLSESGQDAFDLFDFSIYMDRAPLTVSSNSPLEMVHQFFAKLGARYVVVTDDDGYYEGVIDKKTWLAVLNGLEEK
ncbi:voltage-gated chloride channel [Moniliophthora roreri MCA 2997]|uniref:Chloride channel protein n=1 Tax=Moniliophthora roreri (strain MCA 2997) TaxID=1381753 RepID=V2XTK1_MONRO|nr:voltage-gated chloride channel [Moniliophthora roreri MCA 2997]